ncbi:MAG TPA: hypothetical protein VK509_22515, partial [Polyangiales bacterium]|nr:hypothetical protein [Polyangiales bacterium]
MAASSLICTPAYADDHVRFGGGLFFGYRFGSQTGFEFGVEAFSTYIVGGNEPGSKIPRSGVGPLVQVGMLGTQQLQPRITLALQTGGEAERDVFALSAELGLTYRAGTAAGFGLHTGLLPEFGFVNAGISYEWFLEQGWVGGGTRIMPTYRYEADETYSARELGRPLRTDEGLVQLPAAHATRDANASARRARDAIEPVGLAFERDTALEAASVPAFLQLASELADAHAPTTLIRRALQAAADEHAHARLTARLAERHLGRPVLARIPEVARRRAVRADASVLRLAVESWLDGCCAEG